MAIEEVENDEYVILPSNVDSSRYADRNEANDYIVPLSHPLHLTPDWRVGLAEITVPGCIYNIKSPWDRAITISFNIKKWDKTGNAFNKFGKVNIRVRPGQYSPKTFAKAVNSILSRLQVKPPPPSNLRPYRLFYGSLKYEEHTRKMAFHLKIGETIHITHPTLRRMLGFKDGDPYIFKHMRKNPIVAGNKKEKEEVVEEEEEEEEEDDFQVDEVSEWLKLTGVQEEPTEEEAAAAAAAAATSIELQEEGMEEDRGRRGRGGRARASETQPRRARREGTYTYTTEATVTSEGSVRETLDKIATLHGAKPRQKQYRVFRPSDVCKFDINGDQMYVYADIVEYCKVGHIDAPILRTIPIGGFQQGQGCSPTQHFEFKKIHYKKLKNRDIAEIRIKICNEFGEDMPFVEGRSTATLHFRQTKRRGRKRAADEDIANLLSAL